MFATILVLMTSLYMQKTLKAAKHVQRVTVSSNLMMSALQILAFFAIAVASPVFGVQLP